MFYSDNLRVVDVNCLECTVFRLRTYPNTKRSPVHSVQPTHEANAPMAWPITCILNAWRSSIGQTKRDNSRSRGVLKATKEKAIALLPTTHEPCPSSPLPDHGNLTISEGAEITLMEQPQSMLISRLPLEVRIMIYKEVLCKPVGVVHITIRKDGKLVYFRCKAQDGRCHGLECFHDPNDDLYGTWRTRDKDLFSTWSPSNTPNMADVGLVGLLQSCRQVSVFLNTCDILQMYIDSNPAIPKP